MKTTFIGVIVSVFAVTACAQSESTTSGGTETPTVETTTETPTEIKRVTKSEFQTFLTENENVQLIDVRTPGEFQDGAIEGASNIDYNNASFESNINSLDKNAPVLIYCRSGNRSSKALKVFEANGFTHVLELEGGYLNW
ncbi:MAG: rhodanese-like domain-containing protein [Crocinitomix sp.]|nr:rhodanese-like domain-containing protein [Crocinitomix sp.]